MAPVDQGEAGFTLVEVLVAFVVSAMMLVLFFDGMVMARTRDRAIADKQAATELASDLLQVRLAGGSAAENGVIDGRWHWTISDDIVGQDPRGSLTFHRVRVEVRGGKGEAPLARLEARTLRRLANPVPNVPAQ